VPSPLLGVLPDNVLLHFEMDEHGKLVSPQAPQGTERTIALLQAVNEASISIAEQRLGTLGELMNRPPATVEQRPPQSPAPAPRISASGEYTAPWSRGMTRAAPASAVPPIAVTNRQLLSIACSHQPMIVNDKLVSADDASFKPMPAYADSASGFDDDAKKSSPMPAAAAAPQVDLPRNGTWSTADKAIAQQSVVTANDSITRSKVVQMQLNTVSNLSAQNMPDEKADMFKSAQPKEKEVKSKSEVAVAESKRFEKPVSAVPMAKDSQAKNAPQPIPGSAMSAAAKQLPSPTIAASPASPSLMPSAPAASGAFMETLTVKANELGKDKLAQAQGDRRQSAPLYAPASAPTPVSDDVARPLQGYWLDDALILSRQARMGGKTVIQGVWLDWPKLRETLLADIRDLFPDATLEPASNLDLSGRTSDDPLRLAALPLHFAPGILALPALPYWSPLRTSLAIALACMGLAALAVAWVLHGAVSLSERRAAFVSAVTHELRTPLTTFRLYCEMLADDMVQDPEQRRSYLGTLTGEATRLSHLVENVLAYARLERGSARARVEKVSIGQVMERIVPRLRQRTDQAAMELQVSASDAQRATLLHVDVAALEQILFNLVDNACKYAAPRSSEPLIHLEADTDGRMAMLRVRDHGTGIAKQEHSRIFQPFHKSADEAAHSAPGVGLGLALCRRLVAALGGHIALDASIKNGACFVVSLPLA
jgi:signal transduction histidine kinase